MGFCEQRLFCCQPFEEKGGITKAVITTANMPNITTSPNCLMAGCFAKINTPIPINIINADNATVLLYVLSIFCHNEIRTCSLQS